jgi:hypothetical protein
MTYAEVSKGYCYRSNVFVAGDAASRFAGQPATYGVSLPARF